MKSSRVLFQPETVSIATGETCSVTRGEVEYQQTVYDHPAFMLQGVRFELAQNAYGNGTSYDAPASNGGGDNSGGGGGNQGGGDDDQPIVNP